MTEQYKIWFCKCHGHALIVHFWPDDSQDESIVELSMWERSPGFKLGWLDRLRLICQIIKQGTPRVDALILSKADAKDLAKFLTEMSK